MGKPWNYIGPPGRTDVDLTGRLVGGLEFPGMCPVIELSSERKEPFTESWKSSPEPDRTRLGRTGFPSLGLESERAWEEAFFPLPPPPWSET